MQAYEGYFLDGRFHTADTKVRIPERRRTIMTVLDEPARDENVSCRLAAIDEFLSVIDSCDEPVPDFERDSFREVEI